eukprot:365847-Chlamydomonas_euryale.AAC.14
MINPYLNNPIAKKRLYENDPSAVLAATLASAFETSESPTVLGGPDNALAASSIATASLR